MQFQLRRLMHPRESLCSLRRLLSTESILEKVIRNPDVFKRNLEMRKIKIDVDRILRLAQTDGSSEELKKLLRALPNLSHPAIADATSPIEVEDFGQKNRLKRRMIELARSKGLLLDGNSYTTICGDRTYFLTGDLARLERALVRFTMERLKKYDFRMISVPDLLAPHQLEDSGAQVRGQRSQVYRVKLNKQRELGLCGTSEHALANMFRGKTFGEGELPLKLGAVSRCFRAEVSTLKEEKGLYRVHQFTKVEMFGFTEGTFKASQKLQEEFADIEKSLFQELGLHCRVLDMPPIDLGKPAYRKLDFEAWMGGHGFYGEISSTSDCTDFQSNRLGITYRGKPVHTVNGTACAIPRMLIAIAEGHMTPDGIVIPEALRPYMGGRRDIRSQPSFKKWSKLHYYYLENREIRRVDGDLCVAKHEEIC